MGDPDTSINAFKTTLRQVNHGDAERYHKSWFLHHDMVHRRCGRFWRPHGHDLVRGWKREARFWFSVNTLIEPERNEAYA
jgi:hypothetical protein